MNATYIAADNSAGDGQVLGASGQDIYIRAIHFGAATGGKITYIHNARVSTGHASGMGSVATNNLIWVFTQPTFAAGLDQVNQIEFATPLQVDGGSVHTDDDQVTIIWEPVDEATQ